MGRFGMGVSARVHRAGDDLWDDFLNAKMKSDFEAAEGKEDFSTTDKTGQTRMKDLQPRNMRTSA
jgi:hypothetical protein